MAINVSAVILIPHTYLVNIILIIMLLSNLVSALAPLTAYGLDPPVPIYIMIGCSVIGMLTPCFLTHWDDHDEYNLEDHEEEVEQRLDTDQPEVIELNIEQ